VLIAAVQVRAAIILDFESLRADDALLHDHPGALTFEGFTITSVPPLGNALRYSTAGTMHPLFAGSTALFNGQSNAENVLAAADGSAFSLLSIDLAAIAPGASDPAGPTDPGPFDLTFSGTLAGGGSVTNTFRVNNRFLNLERFDFTGFDRIVAVSWFQGAGFNPTGPPLQGEASHQFDRIVVAGSPVVPEPTTALIWLVWVTAAACTTFARAKLSSSRNALRVQTRRGTLVAYVFATPRRRAQNGSPAIRCSALERTRRNQIHQQPA
jgi:hypothetical protein